MKRVTAENASRRNGRTFSGEEKFSELFFPAFLSVTRFFAVPARVLPATATAGEA